MPRAPHLYSDLRCRFHIHLPTCMQAFWIRWACAAGPSDVYLTGYQTMTSFESWKQQHMSPEDYEDLQCGEDDDDSSSGELSSDEEDSEDEGDVPNGVPLLHSEVGRCLEAVACAMI